MDLVAAYNYAAEVMVENMLAGDAEEGIAAFMEKGHLNGAMVKCYG